MEERQQQQTQDRLTEHGREAIRQRLAAYVAKYPSQNKAAASLKGTSAATISAILGGKWEKISDEMFRLINAQLGIPETGWQLVETAPWHEITFALDDARQTCNVTWVVGEAGCGKTTTAQAYTRGHRGVSYILCSEDMRKGDFIREIARTLGLRTDGLTLRQLWTVILDEVARTDGALLIFDEADKLSEAVFHYFISMYNRLEDRAGIVFLSTDYICTRIRRGLQYSKPGYKELYSRIGRKFFELEPTTAHDVFAICRANGIADRTVADRIIRETQAYEFDLRRVKKSIRRELRSGGESWAGR